MLRLFEKCLGADYIHTAEGGDYAIQAEGNTLFLLFECSDGREDWKNNFDFPAKPYKNMTPKWRCHRGFLRVWKAMRNELEIKVAEALKNNPYTAEIVCIGYSHGAAISVLATENFAYLYGDKIKVSGYGFGTPRVLWGVVPREVGERLSRFVSVRNIPDIVTHVPPCVFGFRNAGAMVEIGGHGKYSPVKAHYPEAYINELAK